MAYSNSIDKKDKKEVTYEEVKNNFKNEILLDKGKKLFLIYKMN